MLSIASLAGFLDIHVHEFTSKHLSVFIFLISLVFMCLVQEQLIDTQC